MYNPAHFEESNPEHLHEFIRCNSFATLVTKTREGLTADHLPIYLSRTKSGQALVQGHIATQNPLWKHITDTDETLLIFQGNNSYITPSWLASKKMNGKVVPTWNYTAVHVKGNIRFIHDPSWKLTLLNQLTDQHEAGRSEAWSVSDAPEEFIEKLLPAIVGFEIEVKDIIGKCKLSQNQTKANRVSIANNLNELKHPMATEIDTLNP